MLPSSTIIVERRGCSTRKASRRYVVRSITSPADQDVQGEGSSSARFPRPCAWPCPRKRGDRLRLLASPPLRGGRDHHHGKQLYGPRVGDDEPRSGRAQQFGLLGPALQRSDFRHDRQPDASRQGHQQLRRPIIGADGCFTAWPIVDNGSAEELLIRRLADADAAGLRCAARSERLPVGDHRPSADPDQVVARQPGSLWRIRRPDCRSCLNSD